MTDLNFLNDFVTSNESTEYEKYQMLMYICCAEFGWSEEQFFNADLPFIWDLIETRNRLEKLKEKNSKRR